MKNRTLFFFSVVIVFTVVLGFYYGEDNRNDSAPLTGDRITVEGDMVGGWTAGANIPSNHTFGAAGTFVRNDTAWLFCYSNSPASTLLQSYNSRTNTWATLAPAPSAFDRGCGVVLGDTLYIFGGANAGGVYQTTVMRYHIPSNTWSAGNPMPVAKGWGKALAYQDSLIFIAGGYTGTVVANTPLLYSRITGQYRNCTNMPGARFGGGFAVTGDTLVYIGGADISLLYNQTYVGLISQSDRSNITWTTGIPAPAPFSPAIFRTDAMNWGCKGVILVHGSTTTSFTGVNGCVVYSPGANTYTPQANMLAAALYAGVGSARLSGNIYKLFVAGGYNNTYLTNTQIFTDTLCPAPASGPQVTICRNNGTRVILDNATVYDTLRMIGNNACTITDVNIRLDTILHTWVSDMSIAIKHNNTTIPLVTNRGGSGDNFIGCILNDSAANPISGGTAPFTGPFRPESPLSGFNGQAPNGDWVLSVNDNATGDTGIIRAWCIVVSISCPVGGIQTIEIPNYYSLSQNYPNPFNPSTSIKFTMPKGDNVKLVIFDVLGREVKTLVNEYRGVGVYNVSFDASYLSSGVYFYRLEAGDFTDTKKMLLVK